MLKMIGPVLGLVALCVCIGLLLAVGMSVAQHRYNICRADGWNVVVCIAAVGR